MSVQLSRIIILIRSQINSIDEVPPPVIQIGPTNQTLPMHSAAILPCKTVGNPPPVIKWLKNSELLTKQKNNRILQISDILHIISEWAL